MYKDGSTYSKEIINGVEYQVIDIKPDQSTYKLTEAGRSLADGSISSGYYKIKGVSRGQNTSNTTVRYATRPIDEFNKGWVGVPYDVIGFEEPTDVYVFVSGFTVFVEVE